MLSVDHCWDVEENPVENCAPKEEVDQKLLSIYVDALTLSQLYDQKQYKSV